MNNDISYAHYEPCYRIWYSFRTSKFLCKEWEKLSSFRNWYEQQCENYDYDEVYFDNYSHQLTKHVLSPETCFMNERRYRNVCRIKFRTNNHRVSFRFVGKQYPHYKMKEVMLELANTDINLMLKTGLIIHAERRIK